MEIKVSSTVRIPPTTLSVPHLFSASPNTTPQVSNKTCLHLSHYEHFCPRHQNFISESICILTSLSLSLPLCQVYQKSSPPTNTATVAKTFDYWTCWPSITLLYFETAVDWGTTRAAFKNQRQPRDFLPQSSCKGLHSLLKPQPQWKIQWHVNVCLDKHKVYSEKLAHGIKNPWYIVKFKYSTLVTYSHVLQRVVSKASAFSLFFLSL